MIDHLVQGDQNVSTRLRIDRVLHSRRHTFVTAFNIADRVDIPLFVILVSHPDSHTLGVGVIVSPQLLIKGGPDDIWASGVAVITFIWVAPGDINRLKLLIICMDWAFMIG